MENIALSMSPNSRSKMFAGIPVYDLENQEAIEFIRSRMLKNQKTLLMFANSNFVLKCQEIKPQLNSANVVVFNDGVSIDAASKIMYGKPFKANLNGTDFTPKLLSSLTSHKKVVLIGSKPGIAALAGMKLTQNLGCQVLATFDGYSDMNDKQALIDKVNALKPDIVLVGTGNPLQEVWMLESEHSLHVPLIVGVGAFFDFMSGTIKRAPLWVRNLRLEWLYRLYKEPRRLCKRYTLDVINFFYLCISNRFMSSDK